MAILVVRLSIAKIMYPFYELMSRLVRGEETAKKKSIRNCSYRDRAVAAVAAYVYLQNQTSTGGVTLDFWAPFSEDSVVALWNNVTSAYGNATGNTVRVSMYSGDEFFTKITIALGSGSLQDLSTCARERHHQCSGLLRKRKRYLHGHSRRQSHFKRRSMKTIDEEEKIREAEEIVKERFMGKT